MTAPMVCIVFTTTALDCCDGGVFQWLFGLPPSVTRTDPSVVKLALTLNWPDEGMSIPDPQPQRSQLPLFGLRHARER